MGWDHVTDSPTARADRLTELQAAIAAGTYAPESGAVAESLVGWIAQPRQFDRIDQDFHRVDRC